MATHHVLAQVRHLKNTGRSAVVVLLDVSNAFGSLPHSLLLALMERLGFPLDVMKLLKAVYGVGTYSTMDCGPPFRTTCGVRQGCPLSPTLFVLGMECILREMTDLEPVCYMDDIAVVVPSTEVACDVIE